MPRNSKTLTVGLEIEMVRPTPDADRLATENNLTRHLDHSIRADDGTALPRHGPGAGIELTTPPIPAPVSVNVDGSRMDVDLGRVNRMVDVLCDCVGHSNS